MRNDWWESEVNEIVIKEVRYLGNFTLQIVFNDAVVQNIDFKSFIFSNHHPDICKYRDETLFLSYELTDGDLQWNDYELCFPLEDLYENKNIEVRANNAA